MSARITYVCDRCSAPAGPAPLELSIEAGAVASRTQGETVHLCPDCTEALGRWLRAPALAHPPLRRTLGTVG